MICPHCGKEIDVEKWLDSIGNLQLNEFKKKLKTLSEITQKTEAGNRNIDIRDKLVEYVYSKKLMTTKEIMKVTGMKATTVGDSRRRAMKLKKS